MITALLAVLTVLAGAGARNTQPRTADECWGYNTGGCPYKDVGKHGAVVTEVGTCSAVGIQILKEGGGAADAMIASALCVGVIGGFHSGIGGGGFMLIRFANGDGSHGYEQIDFRETMPAAGNETMYSQYGTNQTKSTIGGLAVGVPGEIRGWQMLHERHGKLPWKRLFEPAASIARNGFIVNYDLSNYLSGRKFLTDDPVWARSYAPDGNVVKEGDTVHRCDLAKTLDRIGAEGPDVFYQDSDIANNIVKAAQASGGILTLDDLREYKAILKNASTISYRGKQVVSTTAPSSGAIVLSILKIFEGFGGGAKDTDPAINLTTHFLVEATKLGYGQRTTLGDPAFTANVSTLEASYLTDTVAAEARNRIQVAHTNPPAYYNPGAYIPSPREGGTSHLAVVDKDGNAISLTTTVNLIWASQVMTENGIILNNEMDDFSSPGQTNAFGFTANPINFIAPGKRPQSSIASSLVEDEDGNLMMATGSAGGSRIITATLQEIYHHVDQGLNATASTSHPRFHEQQSGITYFDRPRPDLPIPIAGFDNGTAAFLASRGNNITYQDPYSSSTSHVIARLPNGKWLAACDPRKPVSYGQAY